ncbi:division/cell wall cluster transcriptional repressor MraZ [Longibacter sp.]|uniref:division/cell wall cluster transcriptional repressor MraZ n=1 Tax=Longibacter sp. TaxID=2045415 RepID=UPI003EBB3AAA
MVFKGQAEYSVDSKGRVSIPAKMRGVLNPEAQNTFTITRGFEECIFLYPLDQWAEIEEAIGALNMFNPDARTFVRAIMMWADEATLDGQGRVTLSRPLLDFADIDGRALIIGAFDHIEIWDPDRFGEYMDQQPDDYETLAERVMNM